VETDDSKTASEDDPSRLLAEALNADEVTDSEIDAVDHALDDMMLEEALPNAGKVQSKSLMTVEDAQAKLSPEILKALAEKFKGSLTGTRQVDERDQIF
jgi:hypothetical protein